MIRKKKSRLHYIIESLIFLLTALIVSLAISPLILKTIKSQNWDQISAKVENIEEVEYPYSHKYKGTIKLMQYQIDISYSYKGMDYRYDDIQTKKSSQNNEMIIWVNPINPAEIQFGIIHWKFLATIGVIIALLLWAGLNQLIQVNRYWDKI
jgi:hypothetical protein